MKTRLQPEFELQCVIADLLRHTARPGLYWSGIEHGEERPRKQDRRGNWYTPSVGRMKRRGVKDGLPDFELVWKGRYIGLEIKVPPNKQTEEQEERQREILIAGGLYRVANSYQEAFDFLDTIGVIRVAPALQSRFAPRSLSEAAA